jgi:ferrous iron transport protein A
MIKRTNSVGYVEPVDLLPCQGDMFETQVTPLSDAKVGNTGIVERIDLPEEVGNYLAHLGFLPGTHVEVLRRAPAGDPTVYRIDGVEVGLRNETARHIFLKLAAGGNV